MNFFSFRSTNRKWSQFLFVFVNFAKDSKRFMNSFKTICNQIMEEIIGSRIKTSDPLAQLYLIVMARVYKGNKCKMQYFYSSFLFLKSYLSEFSLLIFLSNFAFKTIFVFFTNFFRSIQVFETLSFYVNFSSRNFYFASFYETFVTLFNF